MKLLWISSLVICKYYCDDCTFINRLTRCTVLTVKLGLTLLFFLGAWLLLQKKRKFVARNKNLKNKQHKNELMKKISLIVMSCIIACGLFANHGIVKGGEMSPKVEDTVSIDKKITDSQWLSNNSDTLEVDTAGEDARRIHPGAPRGKRFHQQGL